jgi:hypothetical protein
MKDEKEAVKKKKDIGRRREGRKRQRVSGSYRVWRHAL